MSSASAFFSSSSRSMRATSWFSWSAEKLPEISLVAMDEPRRQALCVGADYSRGRRRSNRRTGLIHRNTPAVDNSAPNANLASVLVRLARLGEGLLLLRAEIGRASGRERVWQYV